jgi:hypothetical protein
MALKIPVQLRPAALTPEQIQTIQQVLAGATEVVQSGIENPRTDLGAWLAGKKSYIVMGLTIATAIFGMYEKVFTPEVGTGMILAALGYGAHRSAMTTETMRQTEQIVNAVVNPASPAAEKTAAAAEVLGKPPLTT